MRREPLFIRFLNREIGVSDVVNVVISSSRDEESRRIAQKVLDEGLPDLRLFRDDFAESVKDIIENGISRIFVNYIDSYMKPSLLEQVKGSDGGRTSEERYVMIKDSDTPWVEAVVCYNLCVYMKAYGLSELKCCPVCGKFFSNKGKYAKYCSETCKANK